MFLIGHWLVLRYLLQFESFFTGGVTAMVYFVPILEVIHLYARVLR